VQLSEATAVYGKGQGQIGGGQRGGGPDGKLEKEQMGWLLVSSLPARPQGFHLGRFSELCSTTPLHSFEFDDSAVVAGVGVDAEAWVWLLRRGLPATIWRQQTVSQAYCRSREMWRGEASGVSLWGVSNMVTGECAGKKSNPPTL